MSSTVTIACTLRPYSSLTSMIAVLPGILPTSQRFTEMNMSSTRVAAAIEDGHRLAHRRARRDHVFDNDELIAVRRLAADKAAALAVVLFLLAVEKLRFRDAVFVVERRRGRGERNALRPGRTSR